MVKLFIFVVLFYGSLVMSNEIQWAKDFDSAIEKAKKENKVVMFVSSRHTCKYCVILEKTTFADSVVIEALNKDFISIVAYSDDNDFMPQALWAPGTPAIWFLKPDGKPMYRPLMGAIDKAMFLKGLGIVKIEFDKMKKRENIK